MTNDIVAMYIMQSDLEVLQHLIDVDIEDFGDVKSGYKITFVRFLAAVRFCVPHCCCRWSVL